MKPNTIFLILCLTFYCSAPSFAKEVDLSTIYGKGLYNAPAVIRLKFQNETGKSWSDVSEEDRRDFLIKKNDSDQKSLEAKKAWNERILSKNDELLELRKARLKSIRDLAKEEADRLKIQADEKRLRNKKLEELKRKRQKAREDLRKLQRDNRNRHRQIS